MLTVRSGNTRFELTIRNDRTLWLNNKETGAEEQIELNNVPCPTLMSIDNSGMWIALGSEEDYNIHIICFRGEGPFHYPLRCTMPLPDRLEWRAEKFGADPTLFAHYDHLRGPVKLFKPSAVFDLPLTT